MTNHPFLFAIYLSLLCIIPLAGQEFDFALGFGGTGEDQGEKVTIDPSGNVIVTGYFSSSVDFQNDPSSSFGDLVSEGGTDIFLAKYSSTGSLIWAFGIGGSGADEGKSVITDAAGNVYLIGSFRQTADFDPGAGTQNITSYNNSSDVFLAKYNADGDLQWAKHMGSNSLDIGYEVALDNLGNVIITGYFTANADFDEGGSAANLVSSGDFDFDVFLAKYEPINGNLIWAQKMGSTGQDTGFGLGVDNSNNIYVTGRFEGTVDFNPASGMTFNVMATGQRDVFLAKYQSNGTFLWANGIGGSSEDWGFDLVVDSEANIYLTGHFTGAVDFDPGGGTTMLVSSGSRDAFLAKFASNGDFVWANALGGTNIQDFGYGVALNGEEEPVVCGYFSETVDFDPSICEFTLTSEGGQDVFFAGYDQKGRFRWAEQIGGLGNEEALCIAIDPSAQTVFLTGYFMGTADFDLSGNTFELTSNGDRDIYLTKYNLQSLSAIEFAIYINLQGPFNGGTGKMEDGLRDATIIPEMEPYTDLGFTVAQNEERCLEPDVLLPQDLEDDDIVDWVYVELRSDINTFLTSKAGLLKRDGTIVDPDGTPLSFVVSPGDYFVRIAHRNHLSIVSVDAITVSDL